MSCALHEGILAVPSSSQRLCENPLLLLLPACCVTHWQDTLFVPLSPSYLKTSLTVSPLQELLWHSDPNTEFIIFWSPRMPGMHLFLVSFSPALHILSSSRAQVGFFSLLCLRNSIWQWEEIWMPFCITNRTVAIATHHVIFANPIVFETLPFQSIILTWILFYIFLSCCFASNFLGISICRKFLN